MGDFGFEQTVCHAAISPAAWYNIGLVVVLIALLIAAVLAYRVWTEVNEEIAPATPDELIAAFDQARAEGELDEEEYTRVLNRLQNPTSAVPAAKSSKPPEPPGEARSS